MKKKLQMFVASLAAFIFASMPVAVMAGAHTFAQGDSVNIPEQVCQSVGKVFGDEGCDPEDSEERVYSVVRTILNVFSIVVAVVAVIMIIVGGFRYITSGGDSNGVQAAKNTILYAIVGLVIVLFAQVIVQFVIARLQPEQ